MNLGRHLAVLWRFRALTILGLLAGLVLAVLSSYQVSTSGKFTARGTEEWSSTSSVLVTQSGFPWGRVTLGTDGDPATPGTQAGKDSSGQEFADPGRFSNLAILYSVISYSDKVRASLPQRPSADQIVAVPWDVNGNGTTFLPIVRLTTKDKTADGARKLNVDASAALRTQLEQQQNANNIPDRQRVKLSVLNAASEPLLVKGRSHTGSILALMLALICTVALAHILEALRPRRESDDGAVAAPPVVPLSNGATSQEHAATGTRPSESELPRRLVR